MIVTIDGPAGAGKSTVAKRLAQRLGFQFLDTGAMYRSVTWAALQRGIDLQDPDALAKLAEDIQIAFVDDQVVVDGVVVTEKIRRPDVTENVGAIADAVGVREQMVCLQRKIASQGNFVCEGRDQGTVAFPDSPCKIFLTATPRQRAKRRAQQLRAAGVNVDVEKIVQQQQSRDQRDENRPVGRLQKAADAIEVGTDQLSIDEVVDILDRIVRSRMDAIQTAE